jgi:uncharacterized protein
MSNHPVKQLLIIGSMLLCWTSAATAQAPSPEAMTAARTLVTTLKFSDRYKALLPAILLNIKPALTQDRPEIERDYDAMTATVADAYTPYYNAMIESVSTLYASNFSVEELREIEAFYRRPVGQKFLAASPGILQQGIQIGDDGGRKAAEDIKARLTQLVRQKLQKN